MRDHDDGQLLREIAIGKQVFVPEFIPGAGDAWRGVMRIERARAEAGKVLAASYGVG